MFRNACGKQINVLNIAQDGYENNLLLVSRVKEALKEFMKYIEKWSGSQYDKVAKEIFGDRLL